MTTDFLFVEVDNDLLNIISLISGSEILLHQKIMFRNVCTNFNIIHSD